MTCPKDLHRPCHFCRPQGSKTDDKAATILANCRKAIRDDGTLLIRDNVLSDGDVQGSTADITMLIMTGGEERTESEWRSLLQSAGFALTRVYKKEGQFDLIEAKPDKRPLQQR